VETEQQISAVAVAEQVHLQPLADLADQVLLLPVTQALHKKHLVEL
jgi:hypothetical protein